MSRQQCRWSLREFTRRGALGMLGAMMAFVFGGEQTSAWIHGLASPTLPGTWPYDWGVAVQAAGVQVPGFHYVIGCTQAPTQNVTTATSATSHTIQLTGGVSSVDGMNCPQTVTLTVDAPNNAAFTTNSNVTITSKSRPECWVRGLVTGLAGSVMTLNVQFISPAINGTAAITDGRVVRNPTEGHSNTSFTFGTGSKQFTLASLGANLPASTCDFIVGTWATISSIANITAGTNNYMVGPITAVDLIGGTITVNVVASTGTQTHADWQIISDDVVSWHDNTGGSIPITLGSIAVTLKTTHDYWPSAGQSSTQNVVLQSRSAGYNTMTGTVTSLSGTTLTLNVTSVTTVGGASVTATDWFILSNLPSGWSWDARNSRIIVPAGAQTINNWDFRGAPCTVTVGAGGATFTQCVFDLSQYVPLAAAQAGSVAISNKSFFTSGKNTHTNVTFDGCCSAAGVSHICDGSVGNVTFCHFREAPSDCFFDSAAGQSGISLLHADSRFHVSGIAGVYLGYHPDVYQYTSLTVGDARDVGLEIKRCVLDARIFRDAAQTFNAIGGSPSAQSGVLLDTIFMVQLPLAAYPFGNGKTDSGTVGQTYPVYSTATVLANSKSQVTRANSTKYTALSDGVVTADSSTVNFLCTAIGSSPNQSASSEPAGMGGVTAPTTVLANLASLSWSASVVTVTTTVAHSLTNGQTYNVAIYGCAPSGYNGVFNATVTGASTFTYPLTTNPGANTTAGLYTIIAVSGISDGNLTWQAQPKYSHLYRISNCWADGSNTGANGMVYTVYYNGGGISIEGFQNTETGALLPFNWNYDGTRVGTNSVTKANITLPTPSSPSAAGIGGQPTQLQLSFSNVADATAPPDNPNGNFAAGYQYAFGLATSQATASGNVLTFASVPSYITTGMLVLGTDSTFDSVIPPAAIVTGTTGTTVTLSQNVTGVGVASGAVIAFSPQNLASNKIVTGLGGSPTTYSLILRSMNAQDLAGVNRNPGPWGVIFTGTTTS